MAGGPATRRLVLLTDRWLPWAMWGVLASGLVLALVSTGGSLHETPVKLVLAVLSVFFPLVCARVLVAALRERERRTARLVLFASLSLWAGGSGTLHQAGQLTEQRFPGPAELFFMPAYVGFVAFLLLDARRSRAGVKSWLETAVLCGALVCVAAALLASPLGAGLPVHGAALLLFFFYPLLDFGLLVMLVAQVVLRSRGRGPDTAVLLVAVSLFVGLDLHYAVHVSSGTYYATLLTDALYGVTFSLLATASAMDRSTPPTPHLPERGRGRLLLLGAGVALATLALRPTGPDAVLVTVPASLTLVAAGARLVLALREARGAAEARELSRTDELTGLLNRRALLADLASGIQQPGRLALMLMDLDGFKDVNDTLGHTVGDQLLQEVARRLLVALPEGSLVARIGGDEFALVVADDDEGRLLHIARRARLAVSQRMTVDGVDVVVGASVGISRAPGDGLGATEMLRRADVAMYQVKNAREGEALYDAVHDGFSRDRLQQVEQLRTGISRGELRLWYQPLVDAATQEVTSVEALVRWEHPTLGLLQPVAFLPEARRSGLMSQLSDAVVDMVLADAARWTAEGRDFTVSFNCAPPELLGGRLVSRLLEGVRRTGVPAERVVVEVTEDSFVSDPDRARTVLQHIRDQGLHVAIDDYGTGFSSLAYLRDLPVQTLKLDRSFVRDLDRDGGRVIVESTLQMAHALGLSLVAEGVEDAQTAAALVAIGVDVIQGYHVSRPMPAAEVGRWVDTWQSTLQTST